MAQWLKLPETRDIEDLDNPAVTELHGRIIRRKPFLKKLYTDFYRRFALAVANIENKVLVELGSGGGFIKEIISNVITSDVLNVKGVDKVFSATDMPFEDSSVDAFFMFDVLHHISEPAKFFSEADRCLKTGGNIVMIEPANTPWARFVYTNFHHEGFDTRANWQIKGHGPLSQANGAMAWIFFIRDRQTFENKFPRLKILEIRNHTPLRYLLSGGFTARQLLPGAFYSLVKAIEYILSPANNLLGMFMTVVLEKTEVDEAVKQ